MAVFGERERGAYVDDNAGPCLFKLFNNLLAPKACTFIVLEFEGGIQAGNLGI